MIVSRPSRVRLPQPTPEQVGDNHFLLEEGQESFPGNELWNGRRWNVFDQSILPNGGWVAWTRRAKPVERHEEELNRYGEHIKLTPRTRILNLFACWRLTTDRHLGNGDVCVTPAMLRQILDCLNVREEHREPVTVFHDHVPEPYRSH